MQKTFSAKDNQLFFDGHFIYQAPIKLKILESFEDKVLVFYKGYDLPQDAPIEDINRNILMVRQDGEILWRIENRVEMEHPFTQISKRDGRWIAIGFYDYGGDLDLEDGTLHNFRSFKFS